MKTIIIAIDTGACRITERTLSRKLGDQYTYVFIDKEQQQVETIKELISTNISVENKKVILFSTLGGNIRCLCSLRVVNILNNIKAEYNVIAITPFAWEGTKK